MTAKAPSSNSSAKVSSARKQQPASRARKCVVYDLTAELSDPDDLEPSTAKKARGNVSKSPIGSASKRSKTGDRTLPNMVSSSVTTSAPLSELTTSNQNKRQRYMSSSCLCVCVCVCITNENRYLWMVGPTPTSQLLNRKRHNDQVAPKTKAGKRFPAAQRKPLLSRRVENRRNQHGRTAPQRRRAGRKFALNFTAN